VKKPKNIELPAGVDPKEFELAQRAATAFITHMIPMSSQVQLMAADMAFKAIVMSCVQAPRRLEIYDKLAAAARTEIQKDLKKRSQ
jgi:hypothetical protein